MFRYSNPYVRWWSKKSAAGTGTVGGATATYGGVMVKTALLLGVTVLSAVVTMFATWYGIFRFAETLEISNSAVIGFIVGVIVAVVLMIVCSVAIAIKPTLTKVFGPIYAIIQGAFLGFSAAFIRIALPYVGFAAILGTAIVFAVCILLYKRLGVRIKSNFLRVLVISLVCFSLVQLIMLPIMLFVPTEGMYTAIIWIQAITSFICIVFAAVTVIYDLQAIDYVVEGGADKAYEWPVAFSLVTSLVYLYLQILQLLLRILALFGSRKK